MEQYKIGFYFGLETGRFAHRNRLILVFAKDHLEFRLVAPEKVENWGRYSLDFPVIYTETAGEIQKVTFFKDIPVVNRPITSGLCLSQPNTKKHCATLYCNGKVLFDQSDQSLSGLERDFYNVVIYFAALNNKPLDCNIHPLIDFHLKDIERIAKYVDTVDIVSILSDLSVNVYEVFKSRPGKDDYYYIYREAYVSSPVVANDEFLSKLIGVGDHEIYKDSGFTSCYNMANKADDFIKEHPIGKYDCEKLAYEKGKIISKYSKTEHAAYLMAKYFVNREFNRQFILPEIDKGKKYAKGKLYNEFHLSELDNSERKVEKMFYEFESRNAVANKIVDEINTKIRVTTVCKDTF